MPYAIKSIFYTLQGEGARSGRPAVFVRFAGCNLWSGREQDRGSAVCRFCDTDFVGGERYEDAHAVVAAAEAVWPGNPLMVRPRAYVVFTGGEPALQLDQALIAAFRSRNWETAVETNGTRPLPPGLHWVCVSPKADAELVVTSGDELKLVYPQHGAEPSRYEGLDFGRFYLQPKDGPNRKLDQQAAARYCQEHPLWSLSLQMHKRLGLP